MIQFYFDEDNNEYSILNTKLVNSPLTFKIHEGTTCSFWIEPLNRLSILAVDKWKFFIEDIIFTSYPEQVKEFGDTFSIKAKDHDKECLITIKKSSKFKDIQEVWQYIQDAIVFVINENERKGNTFKLTDDCQIIVT